MENNMTGPGLQTGQMVQKPHKKVWMFLLLAVLVLAAATGGWYAYRIQVLIPKQKAEAVKKTVPANFVFEGTKQERAVAVDSGLELARGQSLPQEAFSYRLDMPRKDVYTKVLAEMQAQGWIAVGGSYTKEPDMVIKLGKGREALFVKLTTINDAATQVTLIPVKAQ